MATNSSLPSNRIKYTKLNFKIVYPYGAGKLGYIVNADDSFFCQKPLSLEGIRAFYELFLGTKTEKHGLDISGDEKTFSFYIKSKDVKHIEAKDKRKSRVNAAIAKDVYWSNAVS